MGRLSEIESIFTSLYDEWMDDLEAYEHWVDFFFNQTQPSSLLELACGTGNITRLIAPYIKEYVASDIDKNMLRQAQNKLPAHVALKVLDMRDFHLDKQFDAIICGADSMNFNEDSKQLHQVMMQVAKHLKVDGTFIFDVHQPQRLAMFKDAYVEVGSLAGVDYQYTLMSQGNDLIHEFAWYISAYPKVEVFKQRVFSETELKAVFDEAYWDLYVENEDGHVGFVSGEKWYLCARYKGGL